MAQTRRRVRVLRLSWPVAAETLAALQSGNAGALESDPSFAGLLAALRADNPLGDFGLYQAVAEISPCWELFQPQGGARPTLGAAGQTQVSTNLMVTIHVDAATPEDEFEAVLDWLVTLHPWEVPVIEIAEAELAVRAN
ncbi:hypothetical protein [Novosphingobium sp. B 225]|uniref:hypothetical protein n=1 Tax=Novosphingobium sp. B 225 TaxID=1961849 RepID=UPI000B4B1D82|nr:hypothetical protein [Novosphingobium sp. B 225]